MAKTEANLEREYVRCALCGGDNSKIKYAVDTKRIRLAKVWMNGVEQTLCGTEIIVACKTCGLVYVNPRLVRAPGLRTYSVEEEMEYFTATSAARQRAFEEMVCSIPRWLGRQPHSLLDIGCGDGLLIQVAKAKGIESAGTEISEPLLWLVRRRVGEKAVFSGDGTNLPEHSFDVVTLVNVLEHVTDPAAILRTAARVLKPDGVLMVHTINMGGLPAQFSGARWYQIEPFNHLYYFTEKTLRRQMLAVGLEPMGRFSLVISSGIKARFHHLLASRSIYLDNGLGIVARPRAAGT